MEAKRTLKLEKDLNLRKAEQAREALKEDKESASENKILYCRTRLLSPLVCGHVTSHHHYHTGYQDFVLQDPSTLAISLWSCHVTSPLSYRLPGFCIAGPVYSHH
ncbi:hypothetical protein J6590_019971 [Homalodisca vitripennis]|nr:hypothetical protein J6590_019971 [Homalodisca vitripennis]